MKKIIIVIGTILLFVGANVLSSAIAGTSEGYNEKTSEELEVNTFSSKESSNNGEYRIALNANTLCCNIIFDGISYLPIETIYVDAGTYSIQADPSPNWKFSRWQGLPPTNIDIANEQAKTTTVTISGNGIIQLHCQKKSKDISAFPVLKQILGLI